mgnify:FL=1
MHSPHKGDQSGLTPLISTNIAFVIQLAEIMRLERIECGFESHRRYQLDRYRFILQHHVRRNRWWPCEGCLQRFDFSTWYHPLPPSSEPGDEVSTLVDGGLIPSWGAKFRHGLEWFLGCLDTTDKRVRFPTCPPDNFK